MGCLHTEKTRYSRFLGLDAIGPSAQLGIAAEGPQPVRPHSPLRLNCWHAKRLEYSDDGREFPSQCIGSNTCIRAMADAMVSAAA